MLKVCQSIIILTALLSVAEARIWFLKDNDRNNISNINELVASVVGDDALFLTPFIENGQIKKGQKLAIVPPMLKTVESFSGFLTVNKTAGSNLFFWLFKSQEGDWEERPLVIWLQGGPGASSLYGLFVEMGPFWVNKKKMLKRRKYSWNREYNLVFIDNPVGAGFSFTKMDAGYATSQKDVGRDLYESIVQLYKLFPTLQQNKLIITGESYAGKYIPAIGYKIYKMNQLSSFKINLAGLMIGNGFTDPFSLMHYGSYLYKLGLVDEQRRDKMMLEEENIRAYIKAGKFFAPRQSLRSELTEILQVTGLNTEYDFVNDAFKLAGPPTQFLNDPKTRKTLHVGSYPFNDWLQPNKHLDNDVMDSVKPWVEELLTAGEFPILYYSGQLDIIVAYPLSVEFYNALQWPYADVYHKAKRCQFRVDNDVTGYYKTAGTFTEVMVRNAGHMVPTLQPKWAFELLDRFINDSGAFKCE